MTSVLKNIPAAPIRSTIGRHDDPTIASLLGPPAACGFLFAADDRLSHLLREADRGYMLTEFGIVEDLIRDRLRGRTTAACDVVRQNAQRHVEERELYEQSIEDAAAYRYVSGGGFYQTARGKQLFVELQRHALNIPQGEWDRRVDEQLVVRTSELARVAWETALAAEIADKAFGQLRHARPAHAALAADAWGCALPALREGSHISAVYHTPGALDLAVQIGLAEELDDILLAQLMVAAIFHDTGNSLEPKSEKKIRRRDIEADPCLREPAIEQRRRHMKASVCLADVYLAARRDVYIL